MSTKRIVDLLIREHRCPGHVVITGGEPCAQNIKDLTRQLAIEGFTVQIETSGTYDVQVDIRAFVTLSPKVGMPGGRSVVDQALIRADELKMPVGSVTDLGHLETLLAHMSDIRSHSDVCANDFLVYLQPLSLSKKATDLCINYAREHDNIRVSLQAHRFIGLR